jgi:hypothetical protein
MPIMKLENRSSRKIVPLVLSITIVSIALLASASSARASATAPGAKSPDQQGAKAPDQQGAKAPDQQGAKSPDQQGAPAAVRYARAKPGGAKLYNLADKKGEVVLSVPGDGLLAVYSQRAGYLEVEAPQSLEVWVYGQFVKTTSDPGLLEITSKVLMRPLPSSDERSYPLEQRLSKGDRVRMIARADDKKPLKEDWIKVHAPPGTRAWVPESDTVAVGSGEDVRAAWAGAVAAAQAAELAVKPPETSVGDKAAQDAAATTAAAGGASLEEAQKMLKAAEASANPDYTASRAAFQAIIDAAPKSLDAATARTALEKIGLLEEVARLRSQVGIADQKRHEELEKANARLRELSLKQDPLWGRFQTRGWVEREGGRYWVRWSGKTSAEIECKNGRYDLANYVGFEVGVTGVTMRSATAANGTTEAQPVLLDVTRVEVISGRVN